MCQHEAGQGMKKGAARTIATQILGYHARVGARRRSWEGVRVLVPVRPTIDDYLAMSAGKKKLVLALLLNVL